MLRQNIIKFKHSVDKFVLSFTYTRVGECLGQVQQLHNLQKRGDGIGHWS